MPGCTKSFSQPHYLLRHQESFHQGQSFECDFPGYLKSYNFASNLSMHKRKAHYGQRYHCEVEGCDKSYTESPNLKRHVERDREGHDVFPCPRGGCQKSYTMTKNLRLHIEADHENRRHPCTEPLCDATFRHPSTIPLHVLKQHGRKDVLFFPPKPGLEVSELATGITLPLAEAQAYDKLGGTQAGSTLSDRTMPFLPSKEVNLKDRNLLRGKR